MTTPLDARKTAAPRPTLRLAAPDDAAVIDALTARAFGDPAIAQRLARLRAAGALAFTLIAEPAGAEAAAPPPIAAFAVAEAMAGANGVAIGVALAVSAEARAQGLGLSLLRAGLAQARKRGAVAFLARSRHRLLARAGFTAAAAAPFADPEDPAWRDRAIVGLALRDGAAPAPLRWPGAYFDADAPGRPGPAIA